MSYNTLANTLAELEAYQTDSRLKLVWASPFVLPGWMQVWWQVFGAGSEQYIRTVKDGDKVIGIAPLLRKDGTAYFLGSTDVCDYQDFIVEPGRETDFFNVLLDSLKKEGINALELAHVRPDSLVMTILARLAEAQGLKVSSAKEAVSVELDLPDTFDAYLEGLDTKQRHEVRRKLRRLMEEGNVACRFIGQGDELHSTMETFYKMFVDSREDKAVFLTDQMKSYFNLLAEQMAREGLLRLGVLELDSKPVAEIMCFDYNDCIYLYNSGYDPQYNYLSAGLLSKVFAIRDGIEKGRKKFDFLKGPEVYKYRLGGKEVPLYRCRIELK